MTFSEAVAELTILRGLAEGGGDLALVKERIARLYSAVCHKTIRRCNCNNKYRDALYEIYYTLKSYENNMEEFNTTARLVNGVVLFVDGKHYTNSNLTDEVARTFLARFPQRKNWFSVLPAEAEDAEKQGEPKVEDVSEKQGEKDAENVAEKPADEVKAEKQPTAPKEKKSAGKRK